MEISDDLFLGAKGYVVRIRKRDGEEVWRTKLKGSHLVVVVVEPDGIFACTRGWLWAPEPDTGAIRWTNKLPGLGYGPAMIASANQIPVTMAAIAAAAWSWREALALTLQYSLATCLGAVLAVGVYETLQGRRPGARALIRRGLVRLPRGLAVVVVVTVPQALLAVVTAVRVEEPWPMPWLSTLGPSVAFPAIIIGSALIVLAWLFLFVAIPAAAVESLGLMRSIERSK